MSTFAASLESDNNDSSKLRWLVFLAVLMSCALWLARPTLPIGATPKAKAELREPRLDIAAERFEFFDRSRDPANVTPPDSAATAATPQEQRPIARRAPPWMQMVGDDATLDNDSLGFAICCGALEGSAWLPALARGRYYLEASVEGAVAGTPVHADTTVGLRASARSGSSDINQFFGLARYGLKIGDTVMLAIDAYQSRVFYGLNGRWLNGQPGGSGGQALDAGGFGISPAFRLGGKTNQRWRINPGTRAFMHAAPGSFIPYIVADAPVRRYDAQPERSPADFRRLNRSPYNLNSGR